MKVKLTFLHPLLGSAPKGDVYEQWIATKAPAAENGDEESATAPDLEKGVTGFHRTEDGQPFIYDYVLKGFFKDACSMLRRAPGTESAKLKAHNKIIDGLVFIQPRQIVLQASGPITMLSRPLRASTAQGDRVAIAVSECLPTGTTAEFAVEILGGVTESALREWLAYGANRGLGQWRNAGYGSFTYEVLQ